MLSGRIHRFERVMGRNPSVVLELDLSLVDSAGEILVHENYREEREATNSKISASTDALGAALHAIFERFLSDIP